MIARWEAKQAQATDDASTIAASDSEQLVNDAADQAIARCQAKQAQSTDDASTIAASDSEQLVNDAADQAIARCQAKQAHATDDARSTIAVSDSESDEVTVAEVFEQVRGGGDSSFAVADAAIDDGGTTAVNDCEFDDDAVARNLKEDFSAVFEQEVSGGESFLAADLSNSTSETTPIRRGRGRPVESFTMRAVERRVNNFKLKQGLNPATPKSSRRGRPVSSNTPKRVNDRASHHARKACDEVIRLYGIGEEQAAVELQLELVRTTSVGKKRFAPLAELVRGDEVKSILAFRSEQVMQHCTKDHSPGLVAVLTEGLSVTEASKATRGRYAPNSVGNLRRELKTDDGVKKKEEKWFKILTGMTSHLKKMGVNQEHEQPIYADFYDRNTSNNSGDRAKPRKLCMLKNQFKIQLHVQYPELLRDRLDRTPSLVAWAHTGRLTRFKKSVLAVIAQAEAPHFCAERESRERYEWAALEYRHKLERKRKEWIRNAGKTPGNKSTPNAGEETEDTAEFDPLTYNPVPRSFPVFLQLLHTSKLKFTMKVFPHRCPYHERGPINVKILEMEREKMAKLKVRLSELFRLINNKMFELSKLTDEDGDEVKSEAEVKLQTLRLEASQLETVPA